MKQHDKKLRRELAIKKARQKRIITISVCTIAVLAFTVVLGVNMLSQSHERVFTAGFNNVSLNNDGTFVANLPHNIRLTGTYTESTEGGVSTVVFSYRGTTAIGIIEDNVLVIPTEWDDGHGHATRYTLR